MTLLDILILLLVVGGAINGHSRGFSLSAFSFGGMLVGVAMGAALAQPIERAIAPGPSGGAIIGVAVLIAAGAIGQSLGYAFGEPLRLAIMRYAPGTALDNVGGAVFSGLSVLLTSWFLGLVFIRGPIPDLSRAIQRSPILSTMLAIFPRPPGFLVAVEQTLAAVPYPQVFSGLLPNLPGPVNVDPSIASNPAVLRDAREVGKIRSLGCGGIVYGSGWPVASNYLISNAHVVAGTSDHRVLLPDGRLLPAVVVLFDPQRDVSILHVAGLGLPPLPRSTAPRTTSGATIGYPGGGNEDVEPAAIRAEVTAVGRDIYGQSEVARDIYVLQSRIYPGDSGGAFVGADGSVLGLIFANSTSDPSQGYSLTDAEFTPDVDAGVGRTRPTDVGGCAE